MAINPLLEKLKMANSKDTSAQVLSQSKFFDPKDSIQTKIPILNAALSGRLDGGLLAGLTLICGPSKHFKSNLCLICVKAYLDKYKDGICIFYDSEYGITPEYLSAHGIDCERVLHIPIEHIEHLKFDMIKRLEQITIKDKVIFFTDSLGNLASKKEVADAEEEKSVGDMSRAKAIKSLFRIITPHLNTKDIPCLMVNHTYEEQGLYGKTIVSGGSGPYYSSNNIIIITRSQEKDGTELVGFKFTLVVEKSRYVKEKSKLPLFVKFDGGISKYSGLLELALESGMVKKPSNGWYSRVDFDTGVIEERKWREDATNSKEFWSPILGNEKFPKFVQEKYQLAIRNTMIDEED